MKREDLEKQGFTKEQIDFIMAENGKDIEAQKTKLTTTETELAGLKTQLTEANTQIESFKKLDVEGVKKAADEWKVKYETSAAESAKQLAQVKFDHALEGALVGAKAKDAKSVRAHLDLANLKLNEADGSVVGLEDQLKKIKETHDYLFTSDKELPRVVTRTNNQSVLSDSVVEAARKAAGLPPPK